jgi:hypothetical protein
MISLKDEVELVKLARSTVKKWFETGRFILEKTENKILNKKRGIFVSIHTYPIEELRGCIGFPYATLPLYEAVQRAAFSSAFEDPRFPPLKEEELNKVIFEISVMTKPKLIRVKNPKEYFEKIKMGKDGLILQNGPFVGLFLPQVWELIPTTERFLESLCLKAGLTKNFWMDKNTIVWKFRVQAFKETKPNGKIIEVKLD